MRCLDPFSHAPLSKLDPTACKLDPVRQTHNQRLRPTMFRLARLLIFVGFGVYLGFKGSALMMQSECSTLNGTWNDTVCLVTEIPQ